MFPRRIFSRAVIVPAELLSRAHDEQRRERVRRPVPAHAETAASELDQRGAETVPEPPPRIA